MSKDLISLQKLANNIRTMPIEANWRSPPYQPYNSELERLTNEAFRKQQEQISEIVESSLRMFAEELAIQIDLSISEETPCLLCRESDVDPLGVGHHEGLFETLKETE